MAPPRKDNWHFTAAATALRVTIPQLDHQS